MLREEPPIRIAVVGGGFGGIYALKELDKLRASLNLPFEVILFEPRDNFVFTPLLHEVATAGLDLDHVTISYKHLFDKKPWLLHAKQKVSSINLTAKKIHAGGKEYRYDYLLLATGSTTNYYDAKNQSKAIIREIKLEMPFRIPEIVGARNNNRWKSVCITVLCSTHSRIYLFTKTWAI
jgi:NADH dehydrogenase FAD-containing subunit